MKIAYLVLAVLVMALPRAEFARAEQGVIFERSYISLDWGQVHLLSSQPSHATEMTPLVCLPPNPYSGEYYRLLMHMLGQDRVMVAVDYPGLGRSDAYPGELDMALMAEILAKTLVLAGWGPDAGGPVDICGYHTGTFLATELAIAYPELVRRLVLIGVPYYDEEGRSERFQRLSPVKPLPESLSELQQDWTFAVEKRAQGVTLDRAFKNFLESARAYQSQSRIYSAVFQYPAQERARMLEHPVLILNPHGNLEEPTRAYAELVEGSSLIELPDLKYGIFDLAPEVIAEHSRRFLAD